MLRFLIRICLISLLAPQLRANEACFEVFSSLYSYKTQSSKAIQLLQKIEPMDLNKPHAYKMPKIDPITIDLTQFKDIVRGHFPGKPIVPGALSAEIMSTAIRTVLKQISGLDYQLQSVDSISFPLPLNPNRKVQLEIDIESLGLSQKNKNSQAIIKTQLKIKSRVVAEAQFTFSTLPKGSIKLLFSPEKQSQFTDLEIASYMPQKKEMLFVDALTYSDLRGKSITLENFEELAGKTFQTSYLLNNHPVVAKNGILPTGLQIEVMAQAAVSGLLRPLKGTDFDVYLLGVKDAHFYENMKDGQQYYSQAKVLDIQLKTSKSGAHSFVIRFKTNITKNKRVISQAVVEGVLILKSPNTEATR